MHIWRHFLTITRHRHKTMYNCFRAGIPWRGLMHDLSKYSPTEFLEGARHYQGTRSPNAREREVKGFSEAWMHHKGRNRHHFEYWTDFMPEKGKYCPVPMPPVYFAEMMCDRVSASKVYQGKNYTDRSALEYWEREKGHVEAHPDTMRDIEKFLTLLAEKGEREFFAALRRHLKAHK
ncbi:MAG: catalase [Clostridia bacterium]|nr:catalase [Clostridia bacterium]